MQVANTERIKQRMGRLIADRNLNVSINRLIAAKVNGSAAPADMAQAKEVAEKFRESMKEGGVTLSENEANVMSILMGLIKDNYQDLFKNKNDESYVLTNIAKLSRWFRKDAFEENPYLRNIKLNNANAGAYRFGKIQFNPGQLFIYNTPRRGPVRTLDLPRIAGFEDTALFPAILKDRKAVKTVTPNEILTMEPHIRAARGNVLALGCGLGYFAYMASLKPEVESVTIVEKDPAIIELFEEHILPQMATASKIHVMEDDPVDFVSDLDDGIYDRCFSNYGDLNEYIKLVKECHKFKQMKTTYWLEDAYCTSLVTYVYLDILNSFYKAAGLKELDMSDAPEAEKVRFDLVQELLADKKIERPEQIDYYMDPANLVYLLR